MAPLLDHFDTYFELEDQLVYWLCRAIRNALFPKTNKFVNAIIARAEADEALANAS